MRALEISGLELGYGDRPVVCDVDLTVEEGEVLALLGPNGAGKSTTIQGLIGELSASAGSIRILGQQIAPLHRLAQRGVGYVGEDRCIFPQLSVAESIRVARAPKERVYGLFPELDRLADRRVGLLSGGEQQMLVVGTALARSPRLILIDELSLGLAPKIVARLLSAVRSAADKGVAVVLVEQHIPQALAVADRAVVLHHGRIALEGSAAEVRDRIHEVEDLYVARADPPPVVTDQHQGDRGR